MPDCYLLEIIKCLQLRLIMYHPEDCFFSLHPHGSIGFRFFSLMEAKWQRCNGIVWIHTCLFGYRLTLKLVVSDRKNFVRSFFRLSLVTRTAMKTSRDQILTSLNEIENLFFLLFFLVVALVQKREIEVLTVFCFLAHLVRPNWPSEIIPLSLRDETNMGNWTV